MLLEFQKLQINEFMNVSKIENLDKNTHLRVLSLNSNYITKIENIDKLQSDVPKTEQYVM
jgi:Leucine-rich repeat (LRR) protein